MKETRITMQTCMDCQFHDPSLDWCIKYHKRLTTSEVLDKKPKWCKVKAIVIEMEE